ncbi:hypothetical protein AKJ61_02320 [candidate division MSBL1 archaeon SCGC-AAA259B11]|uniref:Uncharacterized protein n=1 Tax=candidate division MSBL1 archaeon SCGC-AAA259B11 TaxID=1698260 RepID=A0A133U678_9EURY|nr:hypothetical protein AKJ61_02320 [candidate division MSBL1 archaeon SCGC-AAA259B11]
MERRKNEKKETEAILGSISRTKPFSRAFSKYDESFSVFPFRKLDDEHVMKIIKRACEGEGIDISGEEKNAGRSPKIRWDCSRRSGIRTRS